MSNRLSTIFIIWLEYFFTNQLTIRLVSYEAAFTPMTKEQPAIHVLIVMFGCIDKNVTVCGLFPRKT